MRSEIYDFVEIGTSDFDTLIQKWPTKRGMCIEPLQLYLDNLPDITNITKLNAAIVADESIEEIECYYVHPTTISKNRLPGFLRGCNSVGAPHDFHVACPMTAKVWHAASPKERLKLPSINLIDSGLVTVKKVPALTFEKLINKFSIKHIRYLKTDTEGMCPKILNSVLDFYTKESLLKDLPREIYFEANAHCDEKEVKQICGRLESYGYEISAVLGTDKLAVLKIETSKAELNV